MLIYGKRTVRIKRYADHHRQCPECNAFDLGIKVYKEYFHLFFIPAFPTGKKYADIRCNSCGHPVRTESLQQEYIDKTRNPIYMYTGIILFAGVFAAGIIGNIFTQKAKKRYVADPGVGDIYTIRNNTGNTTSYYFLRLARINGDTVYTNPGAFEYDSYVSSPATEDSFMHEELPYTKKELMKMLNDGKINAVKRK